MKTCYSIKKTFGLAMDQPVFCQQLVNYLTKAQLLYLKTIITNQQLYPKFSRRFSIGLNLKVLLPMKYIYCWYPNKASLKLQIRVVETVSYEKSLQFTGVPNMKT